MRLRKNNSAENEASFNLFAGLHDLHAAAAGLVYMGEGEWFNQVFETYGKDEESKIAIIDMALATSLRRKQEELAYLAAMEGIRSWN